MPPANALEVETVQHRARGWAPRSTRRPGTQRPREWRDHRLFVLRFSPDELRRVPNNLPVSWSPEHRAYVMPGDPELLERLKLAMARPADAIRIDRTKARRAARLRRLLDETPATYSNRDRRRTLREALERLEADELDGRGHRGSEHHDTRGRWRPKES